MLLLASVVWRFLSCPEFRIYTRSHVHEMWLAKIKVQFLIFLSTSIYFKSFQGKLINLKVTDTMMKLWFTQRWHLEKEIYAKIPTAWISISDCETTNKFPNKVADVMLQSFMGNQWQISKYDLVYIGNAWNVLNPLSEEIVFVECEWVTSVFM